MELPELQIIAATCVGTAAHSVGVQRLLCARDTPRSLRCDMWTRWKRRFAVKT